MKHVNGQETPLQLYHITDLDEAKEQVALRVNARIDDSDDPRFSGEKITSEQVRVEERKSGNSRRTRIFFIAELNGNDEVLAEIRKYNKE